MNVNKPLVAVKNVTFVAPCKSQLCVCIYGHGLMLVKSNGFDVGASQCGDLQAWCIFAQYGFMWLT